MSPTTGNAASSLPLPDLLPLQTPQRINELLQNNISPLDSELRELSTTATNLSQQCSGLDDDISAMQNSLDQLKRKRDALGAEVQKYQTVTSPVRRLPADVLCEIFQWNVEFDVSTLSFFDSLDIGEGPWLPSYVCRRWREVALSFSKIWTSVSVKLPSFDVDNGKKATGSSFLLGLQLARSATQFLGVRVEYHDFESKLNSYHPIIITLVPSSTRWKDFVACMPSKAFHALSPLSNILPNLRFADIRPLFRLAEGRALDITPSRLHPISFLDGLPELRELQLADISNPSESLSAFNWGIVRRIDLWKSNVALLETTTPALRMLLQRTTRVEEFFIEGVDVMDSVSDIGLSAVHLECLHSIGSYDSIHDTSVAGADIWSLTQAPKLDAITIVDEQWSLLSVTNMIERSDCRITSLEIRLTDGFLSQHAHRFFEVMPHLTEFTISQRSDAEAVDAVVKMLTLRDTENGMHLPRLQKLFIEAEVFFEPSDLVEFICSRTLSPLARGVHKLKELVLSVNLPLHESKDRMKLKRCVETGFTFINGGV